MPELESKIGTTVILASTAAVLLALDPPLSPATLPKLLLPLATPQTLLTHVLLLAPITYLSYNTALSLTNSFPRRAVPPIRYYWAGVFAALADTALTWSASLFLFVFLKATGVFAWVAPHLSTPVNYLFFVVFPIKQALPVAAVEAAALALALVGAGVAGCRTYDAEAAPEVRAGEGLGNVRLFHRVYAVGKGLRLPMPFAARGVVFVPYAWALYAVTSVGVGVANLLGGGLIPRVWEDYGLGAERNAAVQARSLAREAPGRYTHLEEVDVQEEWSEVDELRQTLFLRWAALAVLVVLFWVQVGRPWVGGAPSGLGSSA